MKYRIIENELIYKGFSEFRKIKIQYETYESGIGEKTVEMVERGDSASIVLFEKDTSTLILAEQFRYPTAKNSGGWIQELVAGRIDDDESVETTIKRELMEEAGYRVKKIERIGHYYVSPGYTTERIFIFYSEVMSNDKVLAGGGKFEESENIKLIKIPVEELEQKIKSNSIIDAKTMIGVQWFLLNKWNLIKTPDP